MSRCLLVAVLLLAPLGPSAAAPAAATPAATAPATAPNTVRYVQLQYTNAAEAARVLNAMYRAMGIDNFASADDRTNTVLLTGPQYRVDRAVELLRQMEQADNGIIVTSVFFMYPLQHAHAAELAILLNQSFGRTDTPADSKAASQPAAKSPAAALAGVAYFVPNPDTNSILITTDVQLEGTIRSLLLLLDRGDYRAPPHPPATTQRSSGLP